MPDPADTSAPGPGAAPGWIGVPERGNARLLTLMFRLSLRIGRTPARLMLYPIAAYFFVFAPGARRHMRGFLERALGHAPSASERFRQVYAFAATILDRLYFLQGRRELFRITIEGEALLEALLRGSQGAFLLGAHLGSFAAVGALGREPGLKVAMAMYEENARKLRKALDALELPERPEVIALGSPTALLRLQERLDAGAFVGVMGDRLRGEEAARRVEFLGAPAAFPLGPLRVAALLRRPVIFMAGLYRGTNQYHVAFEPVADFSDVPPGGREAAVAAALTQYVRTLERYARSDPWNWFNFYDFWA